MEDGFVIDMPGYPEEIEVDCDFPPGYHSNNWVYDLWKSGVWTNFGNITRCIDPNRLVFLLNYSLFMSSYSSLFIHLGVMMQFQHCQMILQ